MDSDREGVIPLDDEAQERLSIYFKDINLRIDLAKEIDKLTNNWNELEEYIVKEWYCFDNESVEFMVARNILDKMQEIKNTNN